MKVILLQDVAKIGRKYDVKEVADGYAANFLIPRKLAESATDTKLKQVEVLKERQVAEEKIQAELLAKNIDALKEVSVELRVKANEQGHLFQGIHESGIALALKEQARIDIPTSMIVLEEPIKKTGDFDIDITIGDQKASFKLSVAPSE